MKNKLILTLALSSLACTFFACDDEEPDPTPSRPTAQCSVPKCEGMSVYLCQDGQYVFKENCKTKCEAGQCVENIPPTSQTGCTNGKKRCNGNIPQTCNSSGLWVSGDTCLAGQTCVEGVCTGTPTQDPDPNKCTGSEAKCEGNVSFTCNAGQFVQNEVCDYKCEDGYCIDEPVEETPCTGKIDGCYCSSATAESNSFCCKGEVVTGEKACTGDTPFCMADGDAPKCVGCRSETDCPNDKPICSANVCEAKNAKWCQGKADECYCRTVEGVDTGFCCEGGEVVNEGWFVPTDCEGNERFCRVGEDNQHFECIECRTQEDCPSGQVCTQSHQCIVPAKDLACKDNPSLDGETCYTEAYIGYIVTCEYGTEKSRQKCGLPQGIACIKKDGPKCGCVHNSDCLGYKCQASGVCTTSCQTEKDCNNDGAYSYTCQDSKCVHACSKDSDCKSGFECKNKLCVEIAEEGCKQDSDCAKDEKCENKQCVKKAEEGCKQDSDCAEDEKCENKQCVKKNACSSDKDCQSGYERKDKVCVEKTPAGGSKTYKETFAGITSTNKASYVDGSFTGTDSGITWTFKSGRIGLDNYLIDGDGIMFYQSSKKAGSLETTLTDGISSLKLEARKAFTGTGSRAVSVSALSENGDKKCEFKLEAKDDVQTMPSCDINLKGEVILLIEQTGAQTTIDNIEWTNNK